MSELDLLGMVVAMLMMCAWLAISFFELGKAKQQKYDLQDEIKWIEKKFGLDNKPKAEIYPSAIVCTRCSQKIKPIAHNTGEGWSFDLECKCLDLFEYLHFDWPSHQTYLTSREVQRMGFEEV